MPNSNVGPNEMKTNTSQRRNFFQVIARLLFVAWIAGAVIAGMHHNYAQKRQCIQDEGWLKGWLWCSTETRNSFGFNMLQGLAWPIEVSRSSSSKNQQVVPASRITQEQFDSSRVGTVYVCWSVALRTKRDGDAETVSRGLAWMKKENPALEALHSDYMHMAGLQVQRIETREGFESYYRLACAEPVANMARAIQQGMIK